MSVITLVLLSPLPSYGVNLSSGIRHMQKHEAWMSFEVRNSLTGMFLASRASTVDETTGATLNVTFLPGERCQSSSVLLFQFDSPSSKKIEEEAIVTLKIDSSPQQYLPATSMVDTGDKFAFYDVSKNFKATAFSGHNLAIFSVENVGQAKFYLGGFAKAWEEAQSTCEGFMSKE